MDLHMRKFDGTPFKMSVEASSPEFRRMKKNAFTGKTMSKGDRIEIVHCVRAADVTAVLGCAGWLVSVRRAVETIRWGDDNTEYYIIYEGEGGT